MEILINSKLKITDDLQSNDNENDQISLFIKNGAFGSGEHETTKACLELISKLDFSDTKVLDIGCGTGILSIAASKFGAKEILGFDPFFSACLISKKNIKLNKIENIDIVCSFNNAINSKYDIVLANIYYYILLDIKEYIRDIINNKGFIILSGIPFSENFDIRNAYEKLGFNVIKNIFHEEFTTILMQFNKKN